MSRTFFPELPEAVPAKRGSVLHVAGSQPSASATVLTSVKEVGGAVPGGPGEEQKILTNVDTGSLLWTRLGLVSKRYWVD